jgi:glutathione peroxidase-family protein
MRHVFVLLVAGFMCAAAAGMGAIFFFAGELADGYAFQNIKDTDLQGKARKLSDHKGKVVLVAFWSSSEPNGRATQASLKQLRQKFSSQTFVIVGVNGDESEALAKSVAERGWFDYYSFYDGPSGPIARSWGVIWYPTFFLLDQRGNVHERYEGFLVAEEVESDIARLIAAGQ